MEDATKKYERAMLFLAVTAVLFLAMAVTFAALYFSAKMRYDWTVERVDYNFGDEDSLDNNFTVSELQTLCEKNITERRYILPVTYVIADSERDLDSDLIVSILRCDVFPQNGTLCRKHLKAFDVSSSLHFRYSDLYLKYLDGNATLEEIQNTSCLMMQYMRDKDYDKVSNWINLSGYHVIYPGMEY